MKLYKYFLIAFAVILIDQTFKLWVYYDHLNWPSCGFMYEQCYELNVIGKWFKLHYLLNPGMAFGFRWENEFGKLALTVFRIAAMFGIAYYLWQSYKKSNTHPGFLICLALILGGAVGNVVDSTFYGVYLDNALPGSPTKWFHGQVIDMLYFPLFDFTFPSWMPFVGDQYFLFFSPVFNIADSSIFIGVVMILVLQKTFFKEKETTSSESVSVHKETHTIVSENGVTTTTEEIIITGNPENTPDDKTDF